MTPILPSTLDQILTLQFAVAWAGEGDTDPPRLGWWQTALVDEYGGKDILQRAAPRTWRWAIFQGVREAALRTDAALREGVSSEESILTLFHLGYRLDERLEDRILDLKRAGPGPEQALPDLAALTTAPWSASAFSEWLSGDGSAVHEPSPIGRQLSGAPPGAPELLARKLATALLPLAPAYPLPHYLTGGRP